MESQERTRVEGEGRASALSSRCVMRVLTDPDMGPVLAYEPEVKTADGRRALVFENDAFFQKVYGYPADWRRLPEADLLRLMREAPL